MELLWREVSVRLVARWVPDGEVVVVIDDTLFHKSGRTVNGADIWRDAVRSTQSRLVTALGLNMVVACVRVRPPWRGEPLALPVNVRLHRKGGKKPIELATEMIRELAEWIPGRRFIVVADGAYAPLVGVALPRTHVISRIRRDAAVYEAAPQRTGRRGRPRTSGDRLPSLLAMTVAVTNWTRHRIQVRSQEVERDLWSRTLLWYQVAKSRPLLLVIVRDPDHKQPPDNFICTDPEMAPSRVAELYADRWCIEVTNRDVKQHLGAEDPQSWKGKGPERVVSLGCWLHSVTWLWFLDRAEYHHDAPDRPWYRAKRAPSFLDAQIAVRRSAWSERIFVETDSRPVITENHEAMLTILAEAA
jgi:DDE superfamily endonuclease